MSDPIQEAGATVDGLSKKVDNLILSIGKNLTVTGLVTSVKDAVDQLLPWVVNLKMFLTFTKELTTS